MKQTSRKLIATSLFAAFLGFSGVVNAQQSNDNWQSGSGTTVLRSGADANLCWRDYFWTPATAAAGCDGALKEAPKAAEAKVTSSKVTLLADALFDFDKSNLKPEGKAKLDDLATKLKGVTLEVIIVIGHTDNIGTAAYNKKLSLRRAESVKAYLVSKGIETGRIYTEGKGFSEPVADNKTAMGRSLNRRAVIEVIGTRKN